MNAPRISASSYSNTAPLIWSFLYGSQHGNVELILDNAPARSAQLLSEGRVDAALVPVIAYHEIEDVRLVPGVCVGARERVRSVCLVTNGLDLKDVGSVALDISSRTSVILAKIIFREFLGFEPEWHPAEPNIDSMLTRCDAALLIGDPALSITECGTRNAGSVSSSGRDENRNSSVKTGDSAFRGPQSASKQFAVFDLAELWRRHTGFGFVFAMWMTRHEISPVDFASARDEGLTRIDEIVSNYLPDIRIDERELREYLLRSISYEIDDDLDRGMELYFELARKSGLCENIRERKYTR